MQIWHPQFFFFTFFKEKAVKENFNIKVGRMYRVEARRNRCTHFSELVLRSAGGLETEKQRYKIASQFLTLIFF
jgi:hypothetical protein